MNNIEKRFAKTKSICLNNHLIEKNMTKNDILISSNTCQLCGSSINIFSFDWIIEKEDL